MRPEDRDAAYLWDMLDAARTVLRITAGVGSDRYLQDRTLQLAVERAIEIIGEAAGRVSETFRRAHPEIPGAASSRSGMSWRTNTATSCRIASGTSRPSISRT